MAHCPSRTNPRPATTLRRVEPVSEPSGHRRTWRAVGLRLRSGRRVRALKAHELVDRLSEDIDLVIDRWDPASFTDAVIALWEAYTQVGLRVEVTRRGETLARLLVVDTTGQTASVDLAADYRGHEPVGLSVGPVLDETDAVATKVAATFSRGLARDYLDLCGILDSGRYTRLQLLNLGQAADAGFSVGMFAEALAAIDRFDDPQFTRYGVNEAHVDHV